MRNEPNFTGSTQKQVFKVPENYFDLFDSRLRQTLKSHTLPVKKVKSAKAPTLQWFSIAAAVTLLVGVSVFLNNRDQYSKIPSDSLEHYLESQQVFLSNSMESYLERQDLYDLEQINSIDQDHLSEYLLTSTDIEYYITD